MNYRSVRFRITAWYGGMFALALTFFGVLAYAGMEQYLDRILRNTLRYDAKAIGETILEGARGRPDTFIESEIEKRSFNARFIRITRAGGAPVYQSKPPADRSFDPRKIGFSPGDREFSRDEHKAGPKSMMVYAYPYAASDGVQYLIETGNTYTRTRQTLMGLAWVFGWIGPLATVLAVAGGWFAIGRALLPVRAITHEAERISWQKRHERLPVPLTGDELEQLSGTLNSMLDRLEDAFQRINRFSADVSHELRTPLTIIRGELESIVRQVPCSPQVLDGVGSSLEEVERLTRIVDHLLVLCRLDAGDQATPNELLDLGLLAADTAEQMRLLFVEKELHLNLHVDPNVWVLGGPVRLKQVIVNLLDNAITYSNTGGTIELTVAETGSRARLEIADSGVGIAPEAIPHLFERFYRADRARSRGSGGVGLGLSIVHAIAASHGGSVNVESAEGRGTRVRFELPIAEGAAETPPTSASEDTPPVSVPAGQPSKL
jgi:heavy metal sensor kinase